MKRDEYLDELFSLPVGLKIGVVIGGQKFYTSEKLKESFVRSFRKSGRGKNIADQIETMVEKGLIVPSFKSKGLLKFFARRMFGSAEDKYALAMYFVNEKRIIVLIDNNISMFGTASNNAIVSTTMHECMHLAAGKNMRKFLQIFTPTLRAFYGNYFEDIFRLKSTPKDLDKVIGFIAFVESPGGAPINKKLAKLHELMKNAFLPYTTMNETQFMTALTDYIVASKILMLNIRAFLRVKNKYIHFLNALDRAYKTTFKKRNKVTGVFQEMYSASEVICVMAELLPKDPKIKKAFDMMSRG